jgi:hypothetical protein
MAKQFPLLGLSGINRNARVVFFIGHRSWLRDIRLHAAKPAWQTLETEFGVSSRDSS